MTATSAEQRLNEVFYARNSYNNTVIEHGRSPTRRGERDIRWARRRLEKALWEVREEIALMSPASDGTDPIGRPYKRRARLHGRLT